MLCGHSDSVLDQHYCFKLSIKAQTYGVLVAVVNFVSHLPPTIL